MGILTPVILMLFVTSLAINVVSLIFLLQSKRSEKLAGAVDAGGSEQLAELVDQVAALRKVVDRLNDTIHEELLAEKEDLGVITEDN